MYSIDNWWEYPEDTQSHVLNVKQKCEEICQYMLDFKCSIRQASQELCIPRSTLHKYIHTYIKTYYDEEYLQIKRLLRYNKQERAKPRKYWVGSPW